MFFDESCRPHPNRFWVVEKLAAVCRLCGEDNRRVTMPRPRLSDAEKLMRGTYEHAHGGHKQIEGLSRCCAARVAARAE